MMLQTLYKQTWEERLLQFDFSDGMDAAGTIASVDSVTGASLGHVAGSVAVTISTVTYAGQVVQAKFAGGTSGETYKITARIVDSDGQRLELDGYLRVQDE